MPYDEGLAQRIRELLEGEMTFEEKKMFGGLAFMVQDYMAVGITGEDLMVRLAKEDHNAAVARPHVRTMDFTGKPMKGFVYVDPEGAASDEDLREWVNRGVSYVGTLPPKKVRPPG